MVDHPADAGDGHEDHHAEMDFMYSEAARLMASVPSTAPACRKPTAPPTAAAATLSTETWPAEAAVMVRDVNRVGTILEGQG